MLIVDIGANNGSFSRHILELGLDINVLAIEPNPAWLVQMELLKSQHHPFFNFIMAALTPNGGKTKLYGASIFGGQVASTLPINRRYRGNEFLEQEIEKSSLEAISVKALSILELHSAIGGLSIDFLKIDAQGLDVLLLKAILEKIDCKSGVIEVNVSNQEEESLYLDQSSEDLMSLCQILGAKDLSILRIIPAEATCREFNIFFGGREFSDPIEVLSLDKCGTFSRYWNLNKESRYLKWKRRILLKLRLEH